VPHNRVGAAPPADGKAAGAADGIAIPAKYLEPTTSGLTTTLKSGSNTYDIALP
jgi:hypothetical protein